MGRILLWVYDCRVQTRLAVPDATQGASLHMYPKLHPKTYFADRRGGLGKATV